MGRLSSVAINPLTAAGDILAGGGGVPVGYGADACIGKTATSDGTSGGWSDQSAVIDGNDNTRWGSLHADAANGGPSWFRVDLVTPQTIGKVRLFDGVGPFGSAGQYASEVLVKVSSDDVTYTLINDWLRPQAANGDTTLVLNPVTARYWRFEAQVIQNPADPPTHPRWGVWTCSLYPVTTVGAGNQLRVPAPAGRRLLSYNPSAALPEWQALESAIPNLTDAFGTADGTVADVGAAFAQGTLNDNFQELSTKVNAILAALRAHGLLT